MEQCLFKIELEENLKKVWPLRMWLQHPICDFDSWEFSLPWGQDFEKY